MNSFRRSRSRDVQRGSGNIENPSLVERGTNRRRKEVVEGFRSNGEEEEETAKICSSLLNYISLLSNMFDRRCLNTNKLCTTNLQNE